MGLRVPGGRVCLQQPQDRGRQGSPGPTSKQVCCAQCAACIPAAAGLVRAAAAARWLLCRQLNLALGLLQAGTALVLLQGMHTGAVAASSWAAWAQLAAAAAGAAFCGSVALPGAAGGAAAALVEVEPTPAPPLSSAEWQAVERGDPSAGAALSGTALVLTMLQLAL